ncbi:signal peptide peptidase SppA [Marinoscillum sp. MHG1-6]|uniref:signal peptide peptidase SppA n=1 Tax=Marinoscillum sp. MHG1-6 TaxID=2959627 RepID=UPI002157D2FC|nr:signal peptide peptidase SppA [Marinoscillum sp. MHG1-6]
MAFLRNLLATLVGLTIFCVLFIAIISGIAASSDAVMPVESNSVLSIRLSGPIMERTIENPLAQVFGDAPVPLDIRDVLASIRSAKTDANIKGIYLEAGFPQAGQSTLLEIRNAILDFKESEKFVYAYGEYVSERDYLVVSAADTLFVNPEGMIEFNGLSVTMTFFKGLFDKLNIEPEIFRVGDYKSAVEPFLRKSMSEENRLQLNELIASIHDTYLDATSVNIDVNKDELKTISDELLVRNPQQAAERGLITATGYRDEIGAVLRSKLGIDADEKIKFVSVERYAKTLGENTENKNKIAVIIAEGEIVMGGDEEQIVGLAFAEEIRKAREDDEVKAVVLRVNSPGGSLTASEIIWRELVLTREVKPVIASMSNVAASGGYFISAPCDVIVAQPNTITGSIGIYGIMFNFGDFLDSKLGITHDRVSTGDFSDIMTVTRSLTPEERQIIQEEVENGFDTFVQRVSEGRSMSREEVLKVAGGRVWSGQQAYEHGLVDVLGSYEDAINIAAEKAGIGNDYDLIYFPKSKEFLERLLEDMGEVKNDLFEMKENPLSPYLQNIESLQRMKGLQARMPGELQVY